MISPGHLCHLADRLCIVFCASTYINNLHNFCKQHKIYSAQISYNVQYYFKLILVAVDNFGTRCSRSFSFFLGWVPPTCSSLFYGWVPPTCSFLYILCQDLFHTLDVEHTISCVHVPRA